MSIKIAFGCDHGGFLIKEEIVEYIKSKGFSLIDLGATSEESSHYPVFAEEVGNAVAQNQADFGVLICGTGVGISIAANKIAGVRAAVCSEPLTARLSRAHNNANIICFGARVVGLEMAYAILDAFFGTEFEGGGRHTLRVDMITQLDSKR